MLIPHRRKDAKLGECWFAANQIKNALIFIRLQSVGSNKFWCVMEISFEMVIVFPTGGPGWRLFILEE